MHDKGGKELFYMFGYIHYEYSLTAAQVMLYAVSKHLFLLIRLNLIEFTQYMDNAVTDLIANAVIFAKFVVVIKLAGIFIFLICCFDKHVTKIF